MLREYHNQFNFKMSIYEDFFWGRTCKSGTLHIYEFIMGMHAKVFKYHFSSFTIIIIDINFSQKERHGESVYL